MDNIKSKEVLNTSQMEIEPSHLLHSSISHSLLRKWQASNISELDSSLFMYPVFVIDNYDAIETIDSMPGVQRYGPGILVQKLKPLVKIGLKSVLLFGVIKNLPKDKRGSNADSESNPVVTAIKILKKAFPNLLIACDVCLCGYTSHGHCGILNEDGTINNSASIQRIAEVATTYGKNGANIVAPSDMMDGRVGAIKKSLILNNLAHKVSVLSYSAKFASALYGPFRDAAQSAPSFGNRKCYQLPPASAGMASRAIARDVAEGADMLMVKPGMPYLDIVKQTKEKYPEYPLFIYQVSGEYSMLQSAASNGAINLEETLLEIILCMRRAGADCIVTYFTPLLLNILLSKLKSKM